MGWFELNDKNVFNIYSLIYDDFDSISKIYDPSTNISTYKDNQKCFRNNDYEEINNIVYSNLYDYFTVDDKKRNIIIELIMEKEPKGQELIFYGENRKFTCDKNYTTITCNISAKPFSR